MVEWYRCVCEECDPLPNASHNSDHYRGMRVTSENNARMHARLHDKMEHPDRYPEERVAKVVKEETGGKDDE